MAAAGGPVNISPREGPTHHARTSMDEAAKKTVLRSFPYGLYAVTVAHGGEEHGMTANWVTQASFEPPMVVVAVENTSKTDRKSTRLNSSHLVISYAVFCLKKKNTSRYSIFFFFNDTATTEIYTLSLHDALPI